MTFDGNDVKMLEKVSERIKERIDSLNGLSSLKRQGLGIEGWFKVETIAALGKNVMDVWNRGPDLRVVLGNEIKEVELKATNLPYLSSAKSGIQKENVDICLFLLGKGKRTPKKIEKLRKEFEIKTKNIDSNWIIGLIKRK